ncbi:MAG: triose-phosphate isomerase [Gammaproteobacteria bacterium]|nr:triose-phosphate isomerase [Gammaproteobacteria bacterium]
MRSKWVMGNWKMNGSFETIQALLAGIISHSKDLKVEVAVAPSYPYLKWVADHLQSAQIHMGAQDLSAHESGAYTGEVSANMLKECGCAYVIVGHSERRQYHAETDALVAKKVKAALKVGLKPVICVGETLQERESGATEAVVSRQLQAVLNECGIEALEDAVIAYEPVWAIGTGLAATPDQVQSVHHFLRSELKKSNQALADKIKIVYGGSVKSSNAPELFQLPDVDGGLIGGASLKADEFLSICRAAETYSH